MVTTPRWAKPTPREVRAQLAKRAPFDRMADEELQWVAERVELRTWPAGAVVLEQGHESPALYFIVEGEAQMEAMGTIAEERRVLAELHPGECFPVEALEEQRPVFSTIRARSELACYQLTTAEFRELRRRSARFHEFTAHRASAFLEQSRRVFHAHFSQHDGGPPALSSPLSILMRPRPLTCAPSTPLREALTALALAGEDGVIVVDPEGRPVGVLDLHGILHHVTLPSLDLNLPVERVMRRPLVQLPPSAFGFEAALLMAERGARLILVVQDGRLAGAVHERDLFGLERVGMGQTSIQIRNATAIEQLVPLSQDVRAMARSLLVQGVAGDQLIRIISTLNDQLTRRVVEIEAGSAGLGDLPFAWIALGSEGRLEQTLSTDQDNGILFDLPEGTDPEQVRARLLPFAQRVNEALASCGFPKCKGGIMAGNPRWCLSLEEWKRAFEQWLLEPEPEALLNACIFFDLRHIHGAERLTQELGSWLRASAQLHSRFLAVFAEAALGRAPPLGVLRDFVVEESGPDRGTLDLKTDGITLFVDAARVLALRHGVAETSTTLRLRAIAESVGATEGDVTAWIDAFQFIELLRMRHQHERFGEARPMDNRIDPQSLNPLDRRILLESLRQAGRLQRRLAAHFGLPGAGL